MRQPVAEPSPFLPDQLRTYAAWRAEKLRDYPTRAEQLVVPVADPFQLSDAERSALLRLCAKTNMAIYRTTRGDDPDKAIPMAILTQLIPHPRIDRNPGADGDGVTALTGEGGGAALRHYIPYRTAAIHWHTDGYYNPADGQVLSMVLHCARNAGSGGENALLDPEMAYLQLRDRHPELVAPLLAPSAMTVPARVEAGRLIRPDRPGPVFSRTPDGHLHMRYTARTRSIRWADDPATRAAKEALEGLLAEQDNPYLFRLTLAPGWGVLCNNVLHTRSAFSDGASPRLLYRIRCLDRLPPAP